MTDPGRLRRVRCQRKKARAPHANSDGAAPAATAPYAGGMSLLFGRRGTPASRLRLAFHVRDLMAEVPRHDDRRLILSAYGVVLPSDNDGDDHAARVLDAIGTLDYPHLRDLARFLDTEEGARRRTGPAVVLERLRDDCVEWLDTIRRTPALDSDLADALAAQLRAVIDLTGRDASPDRVRRETTQLLESLTAAADTLPPRQAREWKSRVARTASAVVLVVATAHAPLDVVEIERAVAHVVGAVTQAPPHPQIQAPKFPPPLQIERGNGGNEDDDVDEVTT
jgi:hypothetical protein